jgi:hypothetical protein
MEECYVVLGISPTASAEEIEKAYQEKKRCLAPDLFEHGSEEWLRASSMQKELDKAYSDAVMATFAPIKAFTVSPPPPAPEPSGPAAPSQAEVFSDLVEEAPASFSDEQLLNMDIGQLRESAFTQNESVLFTWGIEDRLLRRYVKTYAGFVILDLIVNFALGGYASFSITNALYMNQMNRAASALRNVDAYKGMAQQLTDAAQQMKPDAVQDSVLVSILKSFVTTAYHFLCSLPMPIATRFFIMGRPADTIPMRWSLYSFSVAAAVILYSLSGWLIGSWAGSVMPLAFVCVTISATTLKYEEN